jgi:hypothetical protein
MVVYISLRRRFLLIHRNLIDKHLSNCTIRTLQKNDQASPLPRIGSGHTIHQDSLPEVVNEWMLHFVDVVRQKDDIVEFVKIIRQPV